MTELWKITEAEKKKKIIRSEENLRDTWDNIKLKFT